MTSEHAFQEDAAAIARRFVEARRAGRALNAYPGPAPRDMASAYGVQDAAISLWPDVIAGWKIGLAPEGFRAAFQTERIAGPIFASAVQIDTTGGPFVFPVFVDGFAAVEAELVFRIGSDAPADRIEWRHDDHEGIAALIESVHIGVECAGSPFAGINDYGPAVTASDFGNNAGLLIGAAIHDWRTRDLRDITMLTKIDNVVVGEGSGARIPGGPFAALAFILGHTARRGRPLRAGQWISSGALTGVHVVEAGQYAEADFGEFGAIACRAVAFSPDLAPTLRA